MHLRISLSCAIYNIPAHSHRLKCLQRSSLVHELTGMVHVTVCSGNQIELLQEFSFNRFGSTMSVLDFVHLGSSCSLRTFARLASACSVFGMGRFSSSPAFHATKSSSVQGRSKAE